MGHFTVGCNRGAVVLVERAWGGGKTPGLGCHHHYTERLEDAAQQHCLGATTSPEEAIVRKFKGWFNNLIYEEKDLAKVIKAVKPRFNRFEGSTKLYSILPKSVIANAQN